jgi:REP-associated tyrosine transposase
VEAIVEDQINKYHRFSIRLIGYDYSQSGYYFITLVTQDREKLFGVIQNNKMGFNDIGLMIDREWNQIPKRFKNAVLDQYIIMPNHFHGIIHIIPDKKLPIPNKNPPSYNKNNVGMPPLGIHPDKLIVQNKNSYVHPEKMSVYNELPFVKSAVVKKHDINTGIQDHFNGSSGVFNKIQNVCNESQSTGTSPEPAGKTTLFGIIGAFKSITTNVYINGVKNNNWPRFNKRLWQLRFHDRIIRNQNELNRIRKYIIANPLNYHSHTQ